MLYEVITMIPLLQQVGAPSKEAVAAKTSVAFGDMIAKSGGFVSVLV